MSSRNNIKEALDKLNQTDTYSLVLFILYQLTMEPKYATVSKLPYVLDKENLYKFLEVYGGTTVRVPTVAELETVINALLLYCNVNLYKKTFEQAIEELSDEVSNNEEYVNKLIVIYKDICEIMSKYDFSKYATK